MSRVSGADVGAKKENRISQLVGWEAQHSQPTTLPRRRRISFVRGGQHAETTSGVGGGTFPQKQISAATSAALMLHSERRSACQPRPHAPPARSTATRPPPTVMMRTAIFFMMSLSHTYGPPPCSATEAILQGARGTNHCAPDQFADSVRATTFRGMSGGNGTVGRGRGRPTWRVQIESPTMRNCEAPRADPESHRA